MILGDLAPQEDDVLLSGVEEALFRIMDGEESARRSPSVLVPDHRLRRSVQLPGVV